MKFGFCVGVIAAVLALGLRSASADTVTYAIVIGNNAPPAAGTDQALGPLRYADDDAVRYFQLFSLLGEAHLLAVLDETTQRRYPGVASVAEPPTVANLHDVVASYAALMAAEKKKGNDPVFYFAFSGHGALDEKGAAFLSLIDGALTQDVLYDQILARLPASYSHLVIDACNAGGVVGVRGGFFDKEVEGTTAAVTKNEALPILDSRRIARFPHVGVILATTIGQEAHEWSEIESGVFSHELLSGLLGAADINADLRIEYTEIQAFLAAANRNLKDPRAVPQVIARAPRANQNVPLVSMSGVKNTRVLQGKVGNWGHFYIELENGQRYLDANIRAGARVSLLVPNEGDAYLRTATHEARIPAGPRVSFASLKMAERKVAARGSLDTSYRDALFSSAYGQSYYKGYVDSMAAVGVAFSESAPSLQIHSSAPPEENWVPPIAALSLAGISLGTAITAGAVAFAAKNDYDDTDLQRPAQEAKERYERYLTMSVVAGLTAGLAGAAAWWWWPESHTQLVPSVTAGGDYALSMELSW